MKLIFLKPQNLKFILRIFAENFFNKIFKREEISGEVKKYVFENAIRNNPDSVLKAMDNFAKNRRFLMNIDAKKSTLAPKRFLVRSTGISHRCQNQLTPSQEALHVRFPQLFYLVLPAGILLRHPRRRRGRDELPKHPLSERRI